VLAHISAEQLSSALARFPAPGGASLIGLLSEVPARDPVSLLAVAAQLKGLPSGQPQNELDGTQISVLDTAAKMISISDNTAADMLINLVGRSAVEAQDRQWSDHAALNVPS
jgi:beta-lactamase class A